MPKSYMQKRKLKDGTLSILVRFSAPGPYGSTVVRGETIRQRPGETAHACEQRARDLLAERRTAVVRQTYVPPAQMTVAELVDRYLDARAGDLAPASILRYRNSVRWLPKALAATRIDRLQAMDVQAAYGRLLASGYAPNSVKQLHKVLSGSCRQAVAWGILPRSPVAGVRIARGEKRVPAVWSDADVARFLAATADDDRYGDLWRLLVLTGIRLGEALALVWTDIDLERGSLTVRRTMTDDAGGRYVPGAAAKTGRSRRTVALPPSVVAVLRARKRRAIGTVVFAAKDGGHLHDGTVRTAFAAAIRAHRMSPLTPHGLRHTNATNDLAAGIPAKVVADRLGITVQMLLETYGHALPAMHRAAADAVDARIAAASGHDDEPAQTGPKRTTARKTARKRRTIGPIPA